MMLNSEKTLVAAERPLTVAELNRRVRSLLEQEVGSVWIEAEVADATRARSGHVYFTLTDADGKAQVSAVMWQGLARRYGALIRKGVKLICSGHVTLYEARGGFQIVIDRAEEAGAGLKARRLAELRTRLEAEGLFAAERKRPLPPIPECVGLVTSRSGAAIRDIIKVLGRRTPVRLLLAHAQVQGQSAPSELATGLARLARIPEVAVVIVGRGGGSSEDLDAFNSEELVRAVAAHPVPVVSAVGHEIDVTLVDLVADRRAATPSEAAEIVAPEVTALLDQLAEVRRGLATAMRLRLGRAQGSLAERASRLSARDPRLRLRQGMERLARLRESLLHWPETEIAPARAGLLQLTTRLEGWPPLVLSRARGDHAAASEGLYRWPEPALARVRSELGQLSARLDGLSPLASLCRGYSIVRRRPDGAVLNAADKAPAGTRIDVTLARGSLECVVERSLPKSEPRPEVNVEVMDDESR